MFSTAVDHLYSRQRIKNKNKHKETGELDC